MPEPISPARRRWTFVAAMIVSFVSATEVTIVATAMPTIVGSLGDFALFSWVFTAYLLTQGVTVPIYGRLCDFYGRKRVLYIGLVFFVLGSLLCGFAWNMPMLIAFRVVQGLGGGSLATVSQTMVSDLYPPAERAKVQGYISSTFATSALIGPILGAFIVAHWPWPWVFWVNLPLCVLIVVMLELTFRENVELHSHEIDYLGSLLMALATFLLMYALTRAATLPVAMIALLVTSAVIAFVLLLIQERRAREPMLPLEIWSNRMVVLANCASGSIGGMQMAVTAFLPVFIQGVLGESPMHAGLALTALSFAWPTGGFIAGRALLRISYRRSSSLGAIVLVAGAVMMAALRPSLGADWAIASSFMIGLGMGLTNMGFFVAIQASIDWHQRGLVTATFNYARIIGQSIGTAIFGGIVNAALASHIAGEGDLASRILDPSLRETMSPAEFMPLLDAFAGAVHHIFQINVVLAILTMIWAWALPQGLGVRSQMRK
ncbi:MAG TPA: MDR family MFS transporter [Stellaceae bacterium]|jgi:EmrB/QacA subfamily drug resistance transporter